MKHMAEEQLALHNFVCLQQAAHGSMHNDHQSGSLLRVCNMLLDQLTAVPPYPSSRLHRRMAWT